MFKLKLRRAAASSNGAPLSLRSASLTHFLCPLARRTFLSPQWPLLRTHNAILGLAQTALGPLSLLASLYLSALPLQQLLHEPSGWLVMGELDG